MDVVEEKDNEESNESESEYEEHVEYILMEMRVPNESRDIHQYTKCTLKHMDSQNPIIKLQTDIGIMEYQGTYCLTTGSRLLLEERNDTEQEIQMVGKSETRLVFHSLART